MKITSLFLFLLFTTAVFAEKAAPSMHLTHNYPSTDAVVKMQKIKIVQSAYASYFEVNNFTDGYCGLQQTSDPSFGKPNVLIASLWDQNTAGGIFSKVEYKAVSTFTSRFGGEGDGYKSINPYGWKLNTWYNIVNRGWQSKGRLYVATFINDVSSGKWFHTSTLSNPYKNKYLTGYNDSFMENWTGNDPTCDGSYVRQAFFKDCWNLSTSGVWGKNTSASFSVNSSAGDIARNGIYNNSFNAYFDATEDAYCMQHGGNTTPSAAFVNGARFLSLPVQTNQGSNPTLTIGAITSVTAANSAGTTTINWVIDELLSPQLSAKVEIINSLGTTVLSVQDTVPNKRSLASTLKLDLGTYTAKVIFRDIFNQLSRPVSTTFTVTGTPTLAVTSNSLTISAPANSTKTFDIVSNSIWTVASDQSWLTINKSTWSGNATLTLSGTLNSAADVRNATITVSVAGLSSQTIAVEQAAASTAVNQISTTVNGIYPNPVSQTLCFGSSLQNALATVSDVNGKVVYTATVNTDRIELGNLKVGIYNIQLKDKTNTITRKFIKTSLPDKK